MRNVGSPDIHECFHRLTGSQRTPGFGASHFSLPLKCRSRDTKYPIATQKQPKTQYLCLDIKSISRHEKVLATQQALSLRIKGSIAHTAASVGGMSCVSLSSLKIFYRDRNSPFYWPTKSRHGISLSRQKPYVLGQHTIAT